MENKVVILGAGESGVGAALLAKARGFDVFVSDSGVVAPRYQEELRLAAIPFESGKHTMPEILSATEVIKSPGIPPKADAVQACVKAGIKISSEIDFASRFTKAKLVAVTGTNGKTTTTSLIYHLLEKAGYDVAVAGNIGESFARKLALRDHGYFVLEVSSFQLEDIHTFRPFVALLLNITPDHLDRYKDMDAYAQAKFRIVENMKEGDTLIYNMDDEWIAKWMNRTEPARIWKEGFSSAFYEKGALSIPPFYSALFDELIGVQKENHVYENLPLKGKHNAMNISAAILAAMRVGLEKYQIEEGLSSFKGVPHRLEEVANVHGITFINDSKATNVDAVAYALDAFEKPVIWIAGGIDKGNDYSLLHDLVKQKVKGIVCLGLDNHKLIKAFGESVTFIHETKRMEEAVQTAYHLADEGNIVLLSPACASFDLFKNYEDRGNQFRETVLRNYVQKRSTHDKDDKALN